MEIDTRNFQVKNFFKSIKFYPQSSERNWIREMNVFIVSRSIKTEFTIHVVNTWFWMRFEKY